MTNRQIVAEASDWFVTFRFDDADATAQKQFAEWLRRSPEHIQAYLEITEVWSVLPRHDPQGRLDVPALIARARSSEADIVSLNRATGPPRRHPARSRYAWAAAASVLLTLLSLAFWWEHRAGWDTYATEVGEQRSVTLEDGSVVDLNSRSRMRVHISQSEREIDMLEGEALFSVAHDRARPFKVRSTDGTVTAVGTQFDVYKKHDNTLVTVIQGRVAVTRDGSSPGPGALSESAGGEQSSRASQANTIYLSAGEQAVVDSRAVVNPKPADLQSATAWVQKKMIFDFTPLGEVANDFNRYNKRTLSVVDPDLASLQISGVYSSTDPASLLRFLRDLPQVEIVESDRDIRIKKKSH